VRKSIAITILGLFALAGGAHAQLRITDLTEGKTPADLVNRLLGGGITAFNIQYAGASNSAAFVCSGELIVGVQNSVLLTSGEADFVLGPNDETGAGVDNNTGGDADLSALISGVSSNATVLEFDFVPDGDEVTFNYVFGSEEYHEFVNSPFNDVFAFLVNGVNFALIPGTSIPVAINNLNNGEAASGEPAAGPCAHCEFFIDNVGTNNTRNTQLNGLTTVLTFTAPVLAGQTNHIKLAIADVTDGILDSAVFIEAGSLRSGTTDGTDCITRTARYWFTHPYGDQPNCATLLAALERAIATAGCDAIDLGFLELPLGFRNDDSVRDEEDAVIEALGLYFRSTAYTGELGGSQSQAIRASRLCRDRKRLATELIAALANQGLLGTAPENCSYLDDGTSTNFPATLLSQAQATLAGEDVDAIRAMNVLLRKFNFSGLTNDLPGELEECSPGDTRMLRVISRDPTSQFSCPAINESCATAEAIIFPAPTSIFDQPRFQSGANFNRFPNQEAWWKITADVAVSNRTFTVDTFGSNFDTVLTVFSGNCLISTNNGVPVANASALVNVGSNDNADHTPQSKLTFRTTGGQTYYIRVTGGNGRVRFHATSP